MIVPVITVPDNAIEFINLDHVRRLSRMDPLTPEDLPPEDGKPQHVQPNGEPWGSTWIHFSEHDGLRVKGVPEQLMAQWMGPPSNRPGTPSPDERRAIRDAARESNSGIVIPGIASIPTNLKGR